MLPRLPGTLWEDSVAAGARGGAVALAGWLAGWHACMHAGTGELAGSGRPQSQSSFEWHHLHLLQAVSLRRLRSRADGSRALCSAECLAM
jgi:hypothetical protein